MNIGKLFSSIFKADTLAKASRVGGKVAKQVSKHGPTIAMVAGGAAVVGGTVAACKATLNSQSVIEESKKRLETIDKLHSGEIEPTDGTPYTEETYKKDIRLAKVDTAIKVAKNYAPAVGLIGVGLGCMFGSHHVMSKRNATLTAAYITLDQAFKDYRVHVTEKYGESVQRELEHGCKEILNDISDDGALLSPATMQKIREQEKSPYSLLFDEFSREWSSNPTINMSNLISVQEKLSKILRYRGTYVTLNDLADMLDIPRTPTGQLVGWRFDPKFPNRTLDIGIQKFIDENKDATEYYGICREAYLLTPAIDGPVLD